MKKNKCKDCNYYEDGRCKRHPPVPTKEIASFEEFEATFVMVSLFPKVSGDEWCGEFEVKDEE
jgi:hypothetical protein